MSDQEKWEYYPRVYQYPNKCEKSSESSGCPCTLADLSTALKWIEHSGADNIFVSNVNRIIGGGKIRNVTDGLVTLGTSVIVSICGITKISFRAKCKPADLPNYPLCDPNTPRCDCSCQRELASILRLYKDTGIPSSLTIKMNDVSNTTIKVDQIIEVCNSVVWVHERYSGCYYVLPLSEIFYISV